MMIIYHTSMSLPESIPISFHSWLLQIVNLPPFPSLPRLLSMLHKVGVKKSQVSKSLLFKNHEHEPPLGACLKMQTPSWAS